MPSSWGFRRDIVRIQASPGTWGLREKQQHLQRGDNPAAIAKEHRNSAARKAKGERGSTVGVKPVQGKERRQGKEKGKAVQYFSEGKTGQSRTGSPMQFTSLQHHHMSSEERFCILHTELAAPHIAFG